MVGICKQYGYVQPTVYQGVYNAIHRYDEHSGAFVSYVKTGFQPS